MPCLCTGTTEPPRRPAPHRQDPFSFPPPSFRIGADLVRRHAVIGQPGPVRLSDLRETPRLHPRWLRPAGLALPVARARGRTGGGGGRGAPPPRGYLLRPHQ